MTCSTNAVFSHAELIGVTKFAEDFVSGILSLALENMKSSSRYSHRNTTQVIVKSEFTSKKDISGTALPLTQTINTNSRDEVTESENNQRNLIMSSQRSIGLDNNCSNAESEVVIEVNECSSPEGEAGCIPAPEIQIDECSSPGDSSEDDNCRYIPPPQIQIDECSTHGDSSEEEMPCCVPPPEIQIDGCSTPGNMSDDEGNWWDRSQITAVKVCDYVNIVDTLEDSVTTSMTNTDEDRFSSVKANKCHDIYLNYNGITVNIEEYIEHILQESLAMFQVSEVLYCNQ